MKVLSGQRAALTASRAGAMPHRGQGGRLIAISHEKRKPLYQSRHANGGSRSIGTKNVDPL
jgi:hypothetical protein